MNIEFAALHIIENKVDLRDLSELTNTQRQLMAFIYNHNVVHGYSPTFDKIKDSVVSLSSKSSVSHQMANLVKFGYLEYPEGRTTRGYPLTSGIAFLAARDRFEAKEVGSTDS